MKEISNGELENGVGGVCDRRSDEVDSCAYLRVTTIWIYGKVSALLSEDRRGREDGVKKVNSSSKYHAEWGFL